MSSLAKGVRVVVVPDGCHIEISYKAMFSLRKEIGDMPARDKEGKKREQLLHLFQALEAAIGAP